MQITVNDKSSFDIPSKRVTTDEGFLRVPGYVARTGVQEYLACELGLKDRKPNDVIKVYRPDESVFNADSLATYEGCDVTIEHPKGLVTADNYRDISVGTVKGSAKRDGDFVVADLIIKSKDAINAVNSGKVQLSAGYTAVYDEAPKDSKYDFIQRDIKINHVALVTRARAGAQARLFDSKGEVTMIRVCLDADKNRHVDIADEATASLVTDTIDSLNNQLNTAYQLVQDAEAKADAEKAKADKLEEDLEEEKEKNSNDAISDRISEILRVRDEAKKIAGDEFTCDSFDALTIRREALKSVCDSIAWTDKSAAYIDGRWDAELSSSSRKQSDNSIQMQQLAQDAAFGNNQAAPVTAMGRAQRALLKRTGKLQEAK